MKSIAILSNKGGVGKTSIAVNIAVHLAKVGQNVFLLENDFQGPSFMTYFNHESKWINEFMYGSENLQNCIQEIDPKLFELKGKLFVGLANPTHESIKDQLTFDQKRNMQMLQNLVKLKKDILNAPYNVDYLVIDSSPGSNYSTVNAVLVAEACLFIVKISNSDLYGSSEMISGLYAKLKNKSLIIANHIPSKFINDKAKLKKLQNILEKNLISKTSKKNLSFLGWIPEDVDLFNYEFEDAIESYEDYYKSRKVFVHDYPDNIFSKK